MRIGLAARRSYSRRCTPFGSESMRSNFSLVATTSVTRRSKSASEKCAHAARSRSAVSLRRRCTLLDERSTSCHPERKARLSVRYGITTRRTTAEARESQQRCPAPRCAATRIGRFRCCVHSSRLVFMVIRRSRRSPVVQWQDSRLQLEHRRRNSPRECRQSRRTLAVACQRRAKPGSSGRCRDSTATT